MAAQKARQAATLTTAVVVPVNETIVPMHIERINWARKTMELTMATSVPRPRTPQPAEPWPVSLTSNCKSAKQNLVDAKYFKEFQTSISKFKYFESQIFRISNLWIRIFRFSPLLNSNFKSFSMTFKSFIFFLLGLIRQCWSIGK